MYLCGQVPWAARYVELFLRGSAGSLGLLTARMVHERVRSGTRTRDVFYYLVRPPSSPFPRRGLTARDRRATKTARTRRRRRLWSS